MKDLIIGFCELIEYGFDINIACLEDAAWWAEFEWIKDGEVTDIGQKIYSTYWEPMGA